MSTVLILKTVNPDMTSYNGFKWPEKGIVECPDWNPEPVCGGGLHGLLWGCGDGSLLNWNKDAKWIVFEAEESFVVDIRGKVKVPAAEVIYCDNKDGALEILQKARPDLASQMVGGSFAIKHWDNNLNRYLLAVANVGISGIKANTPYQVNANGEFVEVKR